MTDQQTPKSRAHKIIKAWMENDNPSATIENDLYMAIVNEIADAEKVCIEQAVREASSYKNSPQAQSIAIAIRSLIPGEKE